MTQPPLSRQIQKLERSIGVQLLERDNRRVELTGAGVAFLDEAYRLLNLVDTAGDLARRVDAGAAGRRPPRLHRGLGHLDPGSTAAAADGRAAGRGGAALGAGHERPGRRHPPRRARHRPGPPAVRHGAAVVPGHPARAADGRRARGPSAGDPGPTTDAPGLRGGGGDRLPPAAVALLPRADGALPRQRPPADRAAGAPGADGDAARRRRAWPRPGSGLGDLAPRRGCRLQGARPWWRRHPAGRRPRAPRRAARHLVPRHRHARHATRARPWSRTWSSSPPRRNDAMRRVHHWIQIRAWTGIVVPP